MLVALPPLATQEALATLMAWATLTMSAILVAPATGVQWE